jgi:SAM-dependent methyltransferase
VSQDRYAGAADGWATGASIVYEPIAELLIARSPLSLRGARVLDVGAGTGACESPLRAAGTAVVVETDLSHDMLAWNRRARPPLVVSDAMRLPVPKAAFDAAVASFVLNHLTDPIGGLAELARVVRPGGAVLATVFANSSHDASRDAIDQVARARGWVPPDWYTELKTTTALRLGASEPMTDIAATAALVDVEVDEEPVDIGLTDPEALVAYRFGQAQFTDWLAELSADERVGARTAAVRAIGDGMQPYEPRVVFLSGRTANT